MLMLVVPIEMTMKNLWRCGCKMKRFSSQDLCIYTQLWKDNSQYTSDFCIAVREACDTWDLASDIYFED